MQMNYASEELWFKKYPPIKQKKKKNNTRPDDKIF